MDKAAANLRSKLGESLSTVQTFDTPIEQATTPSLEALQAYSLGRKTLGAGDNAAAVPLFQRAIRLDPNFAMAYASLGASYGNLGETSLGAENSRKAYGQQPHSLVAASPPRDWFCDIQSVLVGIKSELVPKSGDDEPLCHFAINIKKENHQ